MLRPEPHIIDADAELLLRQQLPRGWIVRTLPIDYGVDLEVEIVDQHFVTGNRLWIQLKGTTSLVERRESFESERTRAITGLSEPLVIPYVSFPLAVKTVEYAFHCPFPLLLMVADTSSATCYWVPIRDEVTHRHGRVGAWRDQTDVSLRIPTSNTLLNETASACPGLRWYAIEPARMYAFARIHHLHHELGYEAHLSGYSIGDGWIDEGEEELRRSLKIVSEYLNEALSIEVVFRPNGPAPAAMFAPLAVSIRESCDAANAALAMIEAHQFTFQGLAALLGKAQHGVDLLSTAIASYDGYRTRYLLCEANAVFHTLSGMRSPPPFPTRNEPS